MKNQKGWTPGPWRIAGYMGEHDDDGAVIKGLDGKTICSTSGAFRQRDEVLHEDTANARLIASAPDLYDALEQMVLSYEYEASMEDPGLLQAKAALAKARGE